MLASVFGIPTRVHMAPGEATSLGAAITAGVGAGLFESYEQAAKIVRERSNHQVNEQAKEQYKKVFKLYKQIYSRMKPIFDGMADMSGT